MPPYQASVSFGERFPKSSPTVAKDIGYKVRMSYKRPRDALRGLDLEKDRWSQGGSCPGRGNS